MAAIFQELVGYRNIFKVQDPVELFLILCNASKYRKFKMATKIGNSYNSACIQDFICKFKIVFAQVFEINESRRTILG